MLRLYPRSLADAETSIFQPHPSRPETVSIWSAAARAQNAGTSDRLLKRLKFVLRAWSQRSYTRAWLARLVQPDLAPLWESRPRLATKLQRAYVCCAWDASVRCAALFGHYDTLPRLFATDIRAAIYRGGITMLRLVSETGGPQLDVRFFYHDKFEREGELTLAISHAATGLTLAGLTFSIARNGDRRFAIIGGLQASPDPATRNLIHDASRALHGLRPKALALWCLQQLATPWKISEIQAVGDEQHVWRHWRKRREIAACYDEFWRESHGTPLPGGGSWKLPLTHRERSREELKPNRRKQHERRYELLGCLQPIFLSAVAALAPNGKYRTTGAVEFDYARGEPVATPAHGPFVTAGVEDAERKMTASAMLPANHSF